MRGPVETGHASAVGSLRDQLDNLFGRRSDRMVAIVLTWNSSDHVDACIESLINSTVPIAVLVVDNHSNDDTAATVEARWGSTVSLAKSSENLGYAGGNNVGLSIAREAEADVAFLVNPDATVHPRCLEELARCLADTPSAGLVSPAICYSGSDRLWYAGSDFDAVTCTAYHLNEGEPYHSLPDPPFDTGRASGCVLGFRLDVVDRMGALDERYFLYYEEAEWSLRMRRGGLRIVVVPSARAWHDAGHGQGGVSRTYQYYMTRNRLLIAKQHGNRGVRGAIPSSIRDSLVTLRSIARDEPSSFWPCLRAMASGYVDFLRGRFGPKA
jgi:GT2 family glycosyltransferase